PPMPVTTPFLHLHRPPPSAAPFPYTTLFRAKDSGTGTVSGLGTETASGGVATETVTGVLAGSITLKATAPLVPAGTTVTFTVVPGPATAVEYVSPNTTNLASGSTRTFPARIRDAAGNTVTGYSGSITFSQTAGPGTVTGLPDTETVVAGQATSGTITGVLVGNVTVTASSAALTTAATSF